MCVSCSSPRITSFYKIPRRLRLIIFVSNILQTHIWVLLLPHCPLGGKRREILKCHQFSQTRGDTSNSNPMQMFFFLCISQEHAIHHFSSEGNQTPKSFSKFTPLLSHKIISSWLHHYQFKSQTYQSSFRLLHSYFDFWIRTRDGSTVLRVSWVIYFLFSVVTLIIHFKYGCIWFPFFPFLLI